MIAGFKVRLENPQAEGECDVYAVGTYFRNGTVEWKRMRYRKCGPDVISFPAEAKIISRNARREEILAAFKY